MNRGKYIKRCLLFLMTSLVVYSADNSSESIVNGIDFNEYKNFAKQWHLVTVTFRKDTDEMRWVFANEKAWRTLSQGELNYDDGSVFAKVSMRTSEDEQFPTSYAPMGERRFQFMVKNSQKYSEHKGWGFALFDGRGKSYGEPAKEMQNACFACHEIVKNRGYVFSRPSLLASGISKDRRHIDVDNYLMKFSWRLVEDLPGKVKKVIPKDYKKVRFLENSGLRKSAFQGTLDEIKPILEREVVSQGVPAIFLSVDEKMSLSIPHDGDCGDEKSILHIKTLKEDRLLKRESCSK